MSPDNKFREILWVRVKVKFGVMMLAAIIVITTLTMIPLTQLPGRSLYMSKRKHYV
jgi:hypothetical protein